MSPHSATPTHATIKVNVVFIRSKQLQADFVEILLK